MKDKRLSQNQLKMVAVIAMLLDHIGAELLPQMILFRIIGRLAFPIFSYFIYEGFQYTRDKKRYFFRIFTLGILCVVVYYIFSGEWYGNVLITFSCSILVLCGTEFCMHHSKSKISGRMTGIGVIIGCIVAIRFISRWIYIDYGIIGVLLPVFACAGSLLFGKKKRHLELIGFSVGLLLLSIAMGGIQYYCLMAIPLLILYSGQRGILHLKQFFYWFYPVHLAAIGMVAMAIG